jgi:hypothetical protein
MANRPLKIFKMASGLLVAGTAGCLTGTPNLIGHPVTLLPAAAEGPRPQLLQVQPAPVKLVPVEELAAATGAPAGTPELAAPGKEGARVEVRHFEKPAVTLVQAAGTPKEPANAEALPPPKPAEAPPAAPPAAAAEPAPVAPATTPAHPVVLPAAPGVRPAQPMDYWTRCKLALQRCFLGFREEFLAPPLGHYVYLHGKTMAANGDAARMILYEMDFEEGCDRLNLHGHDRLMKICALLPQNFCPLVIERTPCQPGLAEARRLAILNELAHGPFPVPPERVVIGPQLAVGLSGREAELINISLLGQTQADGFPFFPRNIFQGTLQNPTTGPTPAPGLNLVGPAAPVR